MEKQINKTLPIDLSHLKEEPAGTILDLCIKAARKNGWTQDEVALLIKQSTSKGTDEHFWEVICLYTDTPKCDDSDEKEDTRCVRFGVSDIIVGPHEEPSKYAQVFDRNGKILGEVEVYIIGYESCEEEYRL